METDLKQRNRKIGKFFFHLSPTQDINYDKLKCRYKIITDDSPTINLSRLYGFALVIGIWNVIVRAILPKRFEWKVKKTLDRSNIINEEKEISIVNLFTSLTKDKTLDIKCVIELTALRTWNETNLHNTMRSDGVSLNKV